ncbi:hypothetical protein HUT06_16585 [Actinomadura sp. NAK00032]|uniref:hypothetical protein n=1 Tax=Actinomadura sp. NAK00032 TaxID=2742128 RepID=UPI00158FE8D9|nr:hypothetical protein [Actinomadura sp. NAK00032]QKW35457.1 hypothetical protein HUT06_16585 [Actinomadura sp. NAK00032]
MRLSSSLPPAGFTRGEPSPPVRRRMLRTPWLPVAVAALALGAGFFAVGSGAGPASPARTVVPDAATRPPSTRPPSTRPAVVLPPVPEPSPPSKAATARERGKRAPGRAVPKRPRPRSAVPRPAPRKARPHPPARHPKHKARKPRTARPATPSWVTSECRRRFPGDPRRRAACVAALSGPFGR